MKAFLLAVPLLLLPALSHLQADPVSLNDLSAGNALGGQEVLDTIRHAQSVTAQRIDSEITDKPQAGQTLPKLIILGEPFEIPAPEAGELKNIFCQGATYLSPSKSCEFRANVRYSFIKAEDKVDLILCFGCGELEVRRNDKLVSFGPFDGGYGQLLSITQKLFPKDEFLAKFDAEVFRERAARMQVPKP